MNETLLNLEPLKNIFKKYFNDEFILKYWFSKLLHYSTIVGITNEYVNFADLSKATLEVISKESNINLTKFEQDDILSHFKKLSCFNDVENSLKLLRENSIKIIILSNSSHKMIEEQLANAKIADLVDQYYSVDIVKSYKPFSKIYLTVLNKENIIPEETFMVASHDWDLNGAKKVKLKTAYIQRATSLYNPLFQPPDLSDKNLETLVKQIINYK